MAFKQWFSDNIFELSDNQPAPARKAAPAQTTTTTQTAQPVGYTQPVYAQEVQQQPMESEKFRNYFDNVFEEANLPGPDYYEFSKAVQEMLQTGMSQAQAFNSAFIALKYQGLNVAGLIESANKYLAIMDGDKKEFSENLAELNNTEVVGRQQQIEAINKENEAKQVQIAKLNEEIAQNNVKAQTLASEQQQANIKIARADNEYNFAFNVKQQKVKQDIEIITAMFSTAPTSPAQGQIQ